MLQNYSLKEFDRKNSIGSNKLDVWFLLFVTKIIEPQCQCPKCETVSVKFHQTGDNYFNVCRFCAYCNSHFSLYTNTILTRAQISPPVFLALAYCWIHNYTLDNTCAECHVNKNTVTNYFTVFRDSVISELIEGPQPAIGDNPAGYAVDTRLTLAEKIIKQDEIVLKTDNKWDLEKTLENAMVEFIKNDRF